MSSSDGSPHYPDCRGRPCTTSFDVEGGRPGARIHAAASRWRGESTTRSKFFNPVEVAGAYRPNVALAELGLEKVERKRDRRTSAEEDEADCDHIRGSTPERPPRP